MNAVTDLVKNENMEPVVLEWRGPLGFGSLPNTKKDVDDLKLPAVYIFFRCYEGFKGKTLFYVGKAGNFLNRLYDHYIHFLGCNATLYREDSTVFRHGFTHEYFRSIQENLDETIKYAIEDAKRTRFVYAPLDRTRLATVEATMICRLRKLSSENFEIWNTTCKGDVVAAFTLQHDTLSSLQRDRLTGEELDRLLMLLASCEKDS